MFYCFVTEDITNIDNSDPLKLQVNYAELLGHCIYCNIKEKTLYNKDNEKISLNNDQVFLRCSYDKYIEAAQIISEHSGVLKESLSDIEKIEHWPSYVNTVRTIEFADAKEIYSDYTVSKIKQLFHNPEYIFIKSAKKGFSAVVPFEKILKKDLDFYTFLIRKCNECNCNQVLISNYYEIKKDAYGKKEARFFVMDGQILNCSRNLHSLKHTVSKKLTEKAKSIIEEIQKNKDFPDSYILDIVEFVKNGNSFIDVVELNPLTTSMCYVNNSIFDVCAEEIRFIYPRLGMGYEYCYDFLNYESRYVLERYVGENYEYTSDEHWKF